MGAATALELHQEEDGFDAIVCDPNAFLMCPMLGRSRLCSSKWTSRAAR